MGDEQLVLAMAERQRPTDLQVENRPQYNYNYLLQPSVLLVLLLLPALRGRVWVSRQHKRAALIISALLFLLDIIPLASLDKAAQYGISRYIDSFFFRHLFPCLVVFQLIFFCRNCKMMKFNLFLSLCVFLLRHAR